VLQVFKGGRGLEWFALTITEAAKQVQRGLRLLHGPDRFHHVGVDLALGNVLKDGGKGVLPPLHVKVTPGLLHKVPTDVGEACVSAGDLVNVDDHRWVHFDAVLCFILVKEVLGLWEGEIEVLVGESLTRPQVR